MRCSRDPLDPVLADMPEEQKEKDKEPEPERDNTLRNYILGGFILAAVAGQVVSSQPSMMLITMDLCFP